MIDDPTVSALAGARVYGSLAPKDYVLPAVVYRIVAAVPIASLGGDNHTESKRFQFDCVARDYLTMRKLSAAIRSLLLPRSDQSGIAQTTSYTLPDGTFVQGVILHEDHDMGAEVGSGGYVFWGLLDLQFIYLPA